MGTIFSSILWRRSRVKKSKKETLEELESDLQKLTKLREGSQLRERKVVSVLLTVLLVTFLSLLLVGVVMWMWFTDVLSTLLIVVYLSLVVALPLVLYGFKRLTNVWFARRKTQYNSIIQSILAEKKKTIDEVVDTEPFKVAMELLEKYDPKNPNLRSRNNDQTQPVTGQLRQRRPQPAPAVVPQSPHPALQYQTPLRTSQVSLNTPRPYPLAQQQQQQATPHPTPRQHNVDNSTAASIAAATPMNGSVTRPLDPEVPSSGQQFIPPGYSLGLAPGPPTPVPILPRDRTSLDKVVDFMLGDGPSNRYALVCSKCYSHNGMALKDEFEYLSFRCAYCYFLNKAKKTRPLAVAQRSSSRPSLSESFTTNSTEGSDPKSSTTTTTTTATTATTTSGEAESNEKESMSATSSEQTEHENVET